MHQTFYIDIDEEITSIVDRLRKARGKEVIVVVPKRALLIQSIVNLKLLKKEAENLGLSLGIVTQDKLGKLLVEKAGIFLSQKAADQEWESEEILTGDQEAGEQGQRPDFDPKEIQLEGLKRERLKAIGSEDYYSGNDMNEESLREIEQKKRIIKLAEQKTQPDDDGSAKKEVITNKELVVGGGMDIKRKVNLDLSGAPRSVKKEEKNFENSAPQESQPDVATSVFPKWNQENPSSESYVAKSNLAVKNNSVDNKKIEDFFYLNPSSEVRSRQKEGVPRTEANLSGKFQHFFLIFSAGLVVVAALVVAYLFAPKATVAITTKDKSKSVDSEVLGDAKYTDVDFEKEIIPAQLVSVAVEVSQSFPSTGSKSVSNKKARGKITIYNEYSSSQQPLVATTRFSTEDGKIFRLVKGVTVPGMTNESGTAKAGTIEAEVVADESGEQYNIDPTKFSIPGFKGSGVDKYAKIYAKSESQMQGGGAGSEELKSVSQADVDNAKKKVVSILDEKAKEEIIKMAGNGIVVLDDALEKEEATYKLSNSIDEVVSNFEVSAQMNVKAMVFSENDLKEVVNKIIARSGEGKTKLDGSNITLDYGKASPDFEAETIRIKVHGSTKLDPNIDTETIRKDILGKKESEVEAYLSQYTDIAGVEVTYWPSFISGRIPSYEKRVEVKLDN